YKRCPFILHLPTLATTTNLDAEASKLPPVAPAAQLSTQTFSPTTTPSPLSSGETTSAVRGGGKKKRGSAAAAAALAASDDTSSCSSGDSARASPDLLGTSPVPVVPESTLVNHENNGHHHNHSNSQQLHPSSAASSNTNSSGSGMTAVSPERGITPDMKIHMIMALLDPSAGGSGSTAAGVPNKQGLLLNRGSSSQNPFKHTTLWGTDGVVFEAMLNGHVATVILY
ncbi:hypothetical protein BGZ58_006039, partial [Dissophora ornata]